MARARHATVKRSEVKIRISRLRGFGVVNIFGKIEKRSALLFDRRTVSHQFVEPGPSVIGHDRRYDALPDSGGLFRFAREIDQQGPGNGWIERGGQSRDLR